MHVFLGRVRVVCVFWARVGVWCCCVSNMLCAVCVEGACWCALRVRVCVCVQGACGFWLRSLVARFGLRSSLWFHVECLAFCSVGSGDTLGPVRFFRRKHVVWTRHSATSGRRVMRVLKLGQ